MELGRYFEREDLGGGLFRLTQHLKPIAFLDGGSYRPISNDWADGDITYPHVISAGAMLAYSAAGKLRLCPTREPDRYVEIGRPCNASTYAQFALNPFARIGNQLVSANAQADLRVTMGGHFVKVMDVALKGGWLPPGNAVVFPVTLSGLTRSGGQILRDGVPVMRLRAPVMQDGESELVRPIPWEFMTKSGQPYLRLTGLDVAAAGMAQPVIDPQLDLQPDGTAGQDLYMDQAAPTFNYGSATNAALSLDARANKRIGLLKFDLSGIPAGATIDSATLTLTCYANTLTTAGTFLIRRVLAGNSGWIEGNSNGLAAAGEPCWNAKVADGSGGVTTSWAGSAGASTQGTDYAAAALGQIDYPGGGLAYQAHDFTLSASEFQNVLAANHGLIIRATATSNSLTAFRQSEYATATARPKLSITYTAASGIPRHAMYYARMRQQ